MSICRFIREYGILGQKVQHVVGSEATNGPKKRLSNFFSRKKKKSWKKFLPRFFEKPGQKKKILKKENLKKKKIFVLWFEHRISRVLGERHDQARPYEHGGGLREPSTRIELVTLRLLSACSANWAIEA